MLTSSSDDCQEPVSASFRCEPEQRLDRLEKLVKHVGAWLSLVERLVRDQEAGGSNPLAPTN